MVFLTCFSLLLFSNIITALSTFFLSDDLHLINALPVSATGRYAGRFIETAVNSSWTVLFFSSPVFVAYGLVYHASPAYYLALAGVLCPFVLIPAAAGIVLILLLVSLFPARRLKEIMVLAFILLAVGVPTRYFRGAGLPRLRFALREHQDGGQVPQQGPLMRRAAAQDSILATMTHDALSL